MSKWILTITGGASWAGCPPVTTEHASEAKALLAAVAYVLRNWEVEIETDIADALRESGDPGPNGVPDALINYYFANTDESYTITEVASSRREPVFYPRWIDVKVQLPDPGQIVLAWSNRVGDHDGPIRVVRHRDEQRWNSIPGNWQVNGITHWQPLLEYPKE